MKSHNMMYRIAFAVTLLATPAWADLAEPAPATTDTNADIPAASAPANQSQDNFGRFVKKSKAEFDADAQLKAQFKNYGQYVSSLRRHDGEHTKGAAGSHGGSGAAGGNGNGAGKGNGGGQGNGKSGGSTSGGGAGSGGTTGILN